MRVLIEFHVYETLPNEFHFHEKIFLFFYLNCLADVSMKVPSRLVLGYLQSRPVNSPVLANLQDFGPKRPATVSGKTPAIL
jgi:hypothetical protein